jgi:hypothetical protein
MRLSPLALQWVMNAELLPLAALTLIAASTTVTTAPLTNARQLPKLDAASTLVLPCDLTALGSESARLLRITTTGETCIEGVARARLGSFARKLTFVPAGCGYHECHKLRAPSRLMFLYFDPNKLGFLSDTRFANVLLTPRLFFVR